MAKTKAYHKLSETFNTLSNVSFLPEKGHSHNSLVKTPVNTGGLHSCMISYMGVVGAWWCMLC